MIKFNLTLSGLKSDALGEVLHAINNLARAGVKIPEPHIEIDMTLVDLILEGAGANKIQVIKAIREITGLGLKEGKDLVESAPSVVLRAISQADCDKFEALIVAAGGSARRSK